MVLFAKSALTKACLLSQRTFATSRSNMFNYMIKELPIPSKKVPTPDHVKGKLKVNPHSTSIMSAFCFITFNI